MTNGAQSAAGVATYRTMRELGARSPRSHAEIREPNELVVTYRYARAADAKVTSHIATYVGNDGAITLGSDALANLVRDAKCLQKNWHPNIARIRHVDVAADELIVATELVDGATLQDLFTFAAAKRPAGATLDGREPFLPLPVVVRILVDVLAGLHSLHGLRDAASGTLGTIHGALCPANIVVGKDGVARIVNALRPRPVQVGASSGAVGYGAPEALDVGGTSDLRADVHAVGVVLWEALSGRRLYEDADPVRVLARQREEEIEPLTFPPHSPFAGLAEVVLHALAFDPSLRFKTAAEMGAALRTIAGSRIATGSVVAAQVAELAGDRIRARRIELDPSSSGMRRRASLAPMGSAPVIAAEPPAPAPNVMPKVGATPAGYDAPGPVSRRATVPPAALAELDRLGPRDARADDEAPPPSVREELSLRDLMASAPPLHESALVANTPAPSAPAIPAAPGAFVATPAAIPRAGSVPRIALGTHPAPGTGNAPRPAPAKRVANAPAPAGPPVARSVPPKPPPPMSKRPPPAAAPACAEPPDAAEDNDHTLREPHPAEENAPTVVAAADSTWSSETEPVDDAPTFTNTAVMPVQTAPPSPHLYEPTEPPVEDTLRLAAATPPTAAPAQAAEGPPVAAPEWTRAPDKTFAPVMDEAFAASSTDDGLMGMPSAPPPPPLRKMSPAVIGGVAVLALVGAGLALRAVLGGTPAPPTTTAVRPSAELPPPVVTAPPTPAATEVTSAEPNAEAEAKAREREEAAAKAKTEAEAKAREREEAAVKAPEPTTPVTTPPAPQGGAPPAARPMNPRQTPPSTPPGRPKKPYEPSGI